MPILVAPLREVDAYGFYYDRSNVTSKPRSTGMQGLKKNTPAPGSSETNGRNCAGQLFARAKVLARKGRYDEATKLLQKAIDAEECSESESLDLLARIYAQQGRYLEAESCWRKAKDLDDSNPAYDDALNRLRRAHRPFARFAQTAVAVCAFALLALLLWQVLRHNSKRHDATEASLIAIRGDLKAFQQALHEQGEGLGKTTADVRSSLTDLDSRLEQQLKSLATTEDAERQRDAVITHVDDRIAAFQKAFERTAQEQTERSTQLDTARAEEAEVIKSSVADMGKALAAVEGRLAACIKEVERVESSIGSNVKSLPTSADLAELKECVESGVDSIGARFEKLNTAQIKEIEATRASIADLRKALAAVDVRLDEGMRERKDVDAAIRTDLLATASDLTAIGRSVLALQQQLNEISAVIRENKDVEAEDKARREAEDAAKAKAEAEEKAAEEQARKAGEGKAEKIGDAGSEKSDDESVQQPDKQP
jgi:tetratricopeptide (TPR) repeat protein